MFCHFFYASPKSDAVQTLNARFTNHFSKVLGKYFRAQKRIFIQRNEKKFLKQAKKIFLRKKIRYLQKLTCRHFEILKDETQKSI